MLWELVQSCPKGCIDTFIDNIGRYITKNYRVKSDKPEKSLIFTTGIHIVLDPLSNIQSMENLKPVHWRINNLVTEHKTMNEMLVEHDELFRGLRAKFIEELLNKALRENDGVADTTITIPELPTIEFSGSRPITMMEPVFENPNSYENMKVNKLI